MGLAVHVVHIIIHVYNCGVTTADNAHVHFRGNHAKEFVGAIYSTEHVTIAGSVQFINNSYYSGISAVY